MEELVNIRTRKIKEVLTKNKITYTHIQLFLKYILFKQNALYSLGDQRNLGKREKKPTKITFL